MPDIYPTWIRVEDATGQYDHLKGQPLPSGVTVVDDYPEHVGPFARAGKAHTNKAGVATLRSSYDDLKVPELQDEVSKRIDEGRQIEPASDRKADLVAALVADDHTTSDLNNGAGTGDNNETGAAGEGDE